MKVILILLFTSNIAISQQTKLIRTKTADALNTFEFKIPEDFIIMSEADKSAKVESYRKSIISYTSMDRQTDFGINRAFSRFGNDDYELLRNFYKASLMNLYTKVNFIQEEIREINGRKFAVFEFDSEVNDADKTFSRGKSIKKYVYVQYTVVDNNTIVMNFQAPLYQKELWKETAGKIMESIEIK